MTNYYISGGTGFAKNELNAFDSALLSAKVGNYNLVRISSILPPYAVKRDTVSLPQGYILHTAYSTLLSDKKNQIISSGIGIAIPVDRSLPGVIMEFSTYDEKQVTRVKLQEMLEIAMVERNIKEYFTDLVVVDTISNGDFACTFTCVSIW